MMIAGEDFTHVVALAAREHGWDSLDAHAQAYDAARAWLTENVQLVEVWVARPRYADVDALLYRALLAALRGDAGPEPCDNSTLMYVIAAGESWDELPTHMKLNQWVSVDSEGNEGREIPSGDLYDIARLVDGDD